MPEFNTFVILPGSHKEQLDGIRFGQPDPEDQIEIMIKLRHSCEAGLPRAQTGKFLSRFEICKRRSAHQADIALLEQFARMTSLSVSRIDKNQGFVFLSGTISQLCKAFQVRLSSVLKGGRVYRVCRGEINVPTEFAHIITGIFGLDERPAARPHVKFLQRNRFLPAKPDAYDGHQLAKIYNFPLSQGIGQTIALIELGGGYNPADLEIFFRSLGLSAPEVKSISVLGGRNLPFLDPSADIEVALDIQVLGAVVPRATIVVYFAPNTEQGFIAALSAAIHDQENNPRLISIGWGAAESSWSEQAIKAIDALLQTAAAMGISVFVAAGDDGANDNVNDGNAHVDFPASSPSACGCGGTRMIVQNGVIFEVVWNAGDGSATGGGISNVFDRPDYQKSISMPINLNGGKDGRGVPDVAAVADPSTGYAVFVDGTWNIVGGTSAVAPLFAGLFARINHLLRKDAGLINVTVYNAAPDNGFNPVASGNNTCDGIRGYFAQPVWSAVTGLGTPNGRMILKPFVPSSSPQGASPATKNMRADRRRRERA